MEPCTDTSKPDYDTHTHELTDVRSNAKRNILKNAVVADVEGTLTGCLPHRMQSHVLVKFVQIGRHRTQDEFRRRGGLRMKQEIKKHRSWTGENPGETGVERS